MTQCTINVSTEKTLIILISQALNNKLYVNKSYQLFSIMKSVLFTCIENSMCASKKFDWTTGGKKFSRLRYICSVAFNENNEAIGCLFIMGYHSHVYVLPKYRNLGVASKLYIETAKHYNLTSRLLNYGVSRPSIKLKQKFNIGGRLHSLHFSNDLLCPKEMIKL